MDTSGDLFHKSGHLQLKIQFLIIRYSMYYLIRMKIRGDSIIQGIYTK